MKKGPRSWRRLRMIECGFTTKEHLEDLIQRLESEGPIADRWRRQAAGYLRRLAKNERALTALERPIGGRPSSQQRAADIALDYLATKRRLGRGKSSEAKQEVAEAWCVGEATVADYFTNWRKGAEWRLGSLLDAARLQRPEEGEPEWLRLISLDLRDIGAAERESRK